MAKPTLYTDELAERICDRLAEGCDLEEICRDLKGEMGAAAPAPRTVRDWSKQNEAFGVEYASSRDTGEYAIAARMRRTARGKGVDDDGDSTMDVARDKLIIDTEFKLLSKFNPKRWGDKTQTELTGADGAPLFGRIEIIAVEPDA